MKKFIAIVIILFGLTGCLNSTPKSAVESYLKKYKSLDSEVLRDLEDIIDEENLTDDQEEVYRSIMKKQYQDLDYEIIEEEYDNDISYVTVKVTVYDLYTVQNDASVYLTNNPDKFNDENGAYDVSKFIDYKLDVMKNTTGRITYTIVFTVSKEDDKYTISQPTESDLDKIHGVYNGKE